MALNPPAINLDTARYANIGIRGCALVIDLMLVTLANALVLIACILAGWEYIFDVFQYNIAPGIIFMAVYFALFESSGWRGGPGKRIMGIMVVSGQGTRISFFNALIRFVARIVSGATLLVGYFMAAFTDRHRALHDYVANTYVVYRERERAANSNSSTDPMIGPRVGPN